VCTQSRHTSVGSLHIKPQQRTVRGVLRQCVVGREVAIRNQLLQSPQLQAKV